MENKLIQKCVSEGMFVSEVQCLFVAGLISIRCDRMGLVYSEANGAEGRHSRTLERLAAQAYMVQRNAVLSIFRHGEPFDWDRGRLNSLLFTSYAISKRIISPFPDLSLKEIAAAGAMA